MHVHMCLLGCTSHTHIFRHISVRMTFVWHASIMHVHESVYRCPASFCYKYKSRIMCLLWNHGQIAFISGVRHLFLLLRVHSWENTTTRKAAPSICSTHTLIYRTHEVHLQGTLHDMCIRMCTLAQSVCISSIIILRYDLFLRWFGGTEDKRKRSSEVGSKHRNRGTGGITARG